jgi:hypothetical protein
LGVQLYPEGQLAGLPFWFLEMAYPAKPPTPAPMAAPARGLCVWLPMTAPATAPSAAPVAVSAVVLLPKAGVEP